MQIHLDAGESLNPRHVQIEDLVQISPALLLKELGVVIDVDHGRVLNPVREDVDRDDRGRKLFRQVAQLLEGTEQSAVDGGVRIGLGAQEHVHRRVRHRTGNFGVTPLIPVVGDLEEEDFPSRLIAADVERLLANGAGELRRDRIRRVDDQRGEALHVNRTSEARDERRELRDLALDKRLSGVVIGLFVGLPARKLEMLDRDNALTDFRRKRDVQANAGRRFPEATIATDPFRIIEKIAQIEG